MKTFRNTLFGLLIIAFGSNLVAQTAKLRAGNKQFENLAYMDAARIYEDFLRLDKKKDPVETKEALEKLAYSYRKLQDTRNAERIYGQLIEQFSDVESKNVLYYAQALSANAKYRDAQKMYSKYAEMQSSDLRGRKLTVAYMDMNRFYKDSSSYKIDYLPINSRQADFSPMYYKSGIVFVSARDESGVVKRVFQWNQTPFLDLYIAPDTSALKGGRVVANNRSGAATLGANQNSTSSVLPSVETEETYVQPLTKAEIFSKTINTKYHEGPASFFKDYSKMVFTRNNYNKGKTGKGSDKIVKLKLYLADQKGKDWGNVKELPFNSNDYSCGHPAMSSDDSKLYFVSDMPGGYGGTDIYVVEYNGGQWGTPVNLGKEVNTEGNEMFPYIDGAGNIYFASDGHEGLGGLDVFFAELKDGIAYKGVENLGAPVNSEKDDFGLITDAQRMSGYFSSNRSRTSGSDDNIYSFRRVCRQMNIFVFDAKTNTPIEGADVRVLKNNANQDLQQTGLDGNVKLCISPNADYEFKALKEGYATNSVRFSTLTQSAKPNMSVSIYLEKTENTIIRGTVKREATQKPEAGVKVTIRDEKSKTERSTLTGADGGYEFEVDPKGDYTVKAEKNKMAPNKSQLGKQKKSKGKTIENDFSMYGEGDVFRLDDIYYDTDKFFIRPDAAQELDKVVSLLKKYPTMSIELRSFTDSRANDSYNQRLSERRARAAYDYIIRKGIEPDRLTSNGYGENELVNDCGNGARCNDDEHQLNRRTEFKITSVSSDKSVQ